MINLPTVIFRNMIPSFGKKFKQTEKKQKKSRSPENSEDRRKFKISAPGETIRELFFLFLFNLDRTVYTAGDLSLDVCDKYIEILSALVAFEAASYGYSSIGLLLLADN